MEIFCQTLFDKKFYYFPNLRARRDKRSRLTQSFLKMLLLALEMTEGMGGAASYFTGKRVNTVKGVVTDSWDVG